MSRSTSEEFILMFVYRILQINFLAFDVYFSITFYSIFIRYGFSLELSAIISIFIFISIAFFILKLWQYAFFSKLYKVKNSIKKWKKDNKDW